MAVKQRLFAHWRLLWRYQAANLAIAMEYRTAFFAQVFGMILNDTLWLAYWTLFFGRFPVVRGWGRTDVMMLWAIIATGYGLAEALFGAWHQISAYISDGQLDYYLVLPKNALWHALMSRSTPTGWGDLLFGTTVFAVFGAPTPARLGLFLLCAIACGLLMLGLSIACNSLAFFVGRADALARQVDNAMIHFSTYPGSIFDGAVRVLLFTFIPAGFVNHLPVEVMREGNLGFLALAWAAGIAWLALGQWLFSTGLRRYESGNLMGPRL